MMSNPEKNKKRKKYSVALIFIASAIVTTAAVIATIKEGKRIKAENELLAYDVW